ncbi:hypothetical protein DVH24_008135 [Malus domestica]|uniref:Protein Lines C-terminal domain-containing protein n=1 Tax=Malus domestica TaxID=3750 RepID=A0A498JKT3_MALDO|nr:hypothetical protein DVH24_008135 [Malus domestica]
MLVDHEMYFEKCVTLLNHSSNYTLKRCDLLFLQKLDDVLFKVLLQLLSVLFVPKNGWKRKREHFRIQRAIRFFMSYIFNPLRYDHQVLLDYLISKDTGISCAEYLLSLFVEFSVGRHATNRSSKRRKVASDVWSCKSTQSGGKYFKEAKGCLLSLKNSIENLQRKDLFPYNPNVLLNRCVFELSSIMLSSKLLSTFTIQGLILLSKLMTCILAVSALNFWLFDCSLTRFQELCFEEKK